MCVDNIEIIAQYLKSGCKNDKPHKTGIEIEHFITENGTGNNVPYSGKGGVREILEAISVNYDERAYSDGFLIGLANDRYSLSIEPSAQLEISISPVENISEAEKIYYEFIDTISPHLERLDYELVTEGCRKKGRATEQELIPKKRYEFMDKYFKTTGNCGVVMMRSTASVQVSIDYSDEEDFIKKYRLATVLSPLFSLICDNSSYFEGEKYNGRMARSYVWKNVDNDRCGIVPYTFDGDFGFYKYARYIYENPAILIMENNEAVYTGSRKISSIYEHKSLSLADTEHILSMFFPDVRAKKYIEIRPADSMPLPFALSYAAFIKGIFESKDIPDIKGITVKDVEDAKDVLMENGFDAIIYGKRADDMCDELLECAKSNLNESDLSYIKPIENIIKSRKTLREMK